MKRKKIETFFFLPFTAIKQFKLEKVNLKLAGLDAQKLS